MNKRTFLVPALAAGLLLILAAPAQAALSIIQPIDVEASTELSGFFNRTGERSIDGSGLTDPSIVQTGSPVPAVWPGHINNAGSGTSASMWLSGNVGTDQISNQWIMFDLGQTYDLRGMHLWNYNETNPGDLTNRATEDIRLSFATTLNSFGDPTDPNWSAPMDMTLIRPPGSPNTLNSDYTGETYGFPDVEARYVLFDIQSNYGSTYVGLAEVRFLTPEPAKSLLLAIGAMTVFLRRRRR